MTANKDKSSYHKGRRLTDERAEQIAQEVLDKAETMTTADIQRARRPAGTLRKRLGRPRLDGATHERPTPQVRVRVSEQMLEALDARAAREHRSRSEVARSALEAYISQQI